MYRKQQATLTHAFKSTYSKQSKETGTENSPLLLPHSQSACAVHHGEWGLGTAQEESDSITTRTPRTLCHTLNLLPVHICTYVVFYWHSPGICLPLQPLVELKGNVLPGLFLQPFFSTQLTDTLKFLTLQCRAPRCSDVYLFWGHAF